MIFSIPEVNAEKGLAFCDNDTDMFLFILRSYVSNIPVTLDKIRTVSLETLNDYYIRVHGLKGTSANLGVEKISVAAKNLEIMAKAGDLNGVLADNDSFIKDLENTIAAIKAWLEQYDSKQSSPQPQL